MFKQDLQELWLGGRLRTLLQHRGGVTEPHHGLERNDSHLNLSFFINAWSAASFRGLLAIVKEEIYFASTHLSSTVTKY